MSFFELFFGCSHVWFSFRERNIFLMFTDGINIEYKIIPKFCVRCSAVKWEQVK